MIWVYSYLSIDIIVFLPILIMVYSHLFISTYSWLYLLIFVYAYQSVDVNLFLPISVDICIYLPIFWYHLIPDYIYWYPSVHICLLTSTYSCWSLLISTYSLLYWYRSIHTSLLISTDIYWKPIHTYSCLYKFISVFKSIYISLFRTPMTNNIHICWILRVKSLGNFSLYYLIKQDSFLLEYIPICISFFQTPNNESSYWCTCGHN